MASSISVQFTTRQGVKTLKLATGSTVADVIAKEQANAETFLINLNGKLAHPATTLSDGDALEFVHVIYGG